MNEATSIGQWIIVAGIVGNFILVWVKLSGKPEKREIQQPLRVAEEPEYAPKNHEHPDYISRTECRLSHQQSSQDGTKKIEDVQRQLDHLGKELKAGISAIGKDAETRAAKLHARVDPIAQLAASTTDRLDDHLKDHRAKGAPNG